MFGLIALCGIIKKNFNIFFSLSMNDLTVFRIWEELVWILTLMNCHNFHFNTPWTGLNPGKITNWQVVWVPHKGAQKKFLIIFFSIIAECLCSKLERKHKFINLYIYQSHFWRSRIFKTLICLLVTNHVCTTNLSKLAVKNQASQRTAVFYPAEFPVFLINI